LTNIDNEATPTKHSMMSDEVTPRPDHGDGSEDLGPSFSSSNPFADLEPPSSAIEDRYSMLKPDNSQYGAEPDVYGSLEPDLFTSTENPFTPTVGEEDPFTAVTTEDPFSQQAEQDPFTKADPFSSADADPFAKGEDPFQDKEDPFNSTNEDPFKTTEDPFSKDTADPFDSKTEGDPFKGQTEDPFSTVQSEDPFSSKVADPFGGSQFSTEDPFKENEDPFSSLPGDELGAKGPLYSMRALYAFEPDNEDELAFTEGDTIEIVEEVNEEWLIGRCKGNEGLFPAAFAERIA